MELKEKFAQKMLDGKLNHLPIKESYELYKAGIIVPTREHYVISLEEFDEWDYKGSEVEYYIKECLKEYKDLEEAFDNDLIEIGDDYDHFEEFTYGLFPAPTYIELIK